MNLVNDIRAGRVVPPSGISTLGLDTTHHWLISVEPGEVTMVWTVDPAYFNLDGAVICSWLIALADQALFFASNAACAEGESTRMRKLRFETEHNITGGDVTITGTITEREDDQMTGSCVFRLEDGRVAATVEAMIQVIG